MEFSNFEIAIAFAITLFGVAVMCSGFMTMYRSVSSKTWNMVDGVVTVSRRVLSGWNGEMIRWLSWIPFLKYEYTIAGRKYSGSMLYFGWRMHEKIKMYSEIATDDSVHAGKKYSDEIVRRFPEGSRIKAYVSPQEPSVSVLEPGLHWEAVFIALIGTIFSVIGLYGLFTFY